MQIPDHFSVYVVSYFRPLLGSLALLTAVMGGASAVTAQAPSAAPGSGYHLEATWKPGGEGGWDYATVDSSTHRLYVTRTDRVQVIDTENGQTVGEVPGLEGGHGTALVPDENRGFATSGKSGTVVVFDLKTLKAVGEPIKVGQKPDAIVYDPASKHVFAFNGESDDASVIDAATAKVIATIPLGGEPEFAGSDGKGTLFVTGPTTSSSQAVQAIDRDGNTTVFFKGLGRAQGLAFDVDDNLYIAASLHGQRGIVRLTPAAEPSLILSGNNLVGLAFLEDGCAALATRDALFHVDLGIEGRPLV